MLACTTTNKAIDSLVAKLEASGVTEMLCVGSAERMSNCSRRYRMEARLERDATIAKGEAVLAKATHSRECHEQRVAKLQKPTKPKRGVDGRENNRGFVERQLRKHHAHLPVDLRVRGLVSARYEHDGLALPDGADDARPAPDSSVSTMDAARCAPCED